MKASWLAWLSDLVGQRCQRQGDGRQEAHGGGVFPNRRELWQWYVSGTSHHAVMDPYFPAWWCVLNIFKEMSRPSLPRSSQVFTVKRCQKDPVIIQATGHRQVSLHQPGGGSGTGAGASRERGEAVFPAVAWYHFQIHFHIYIYIYTYTDYPTLSDIVHLCEHTIEIS